jgi:hypothetical protein
MDTKEMYGVDLGFLPNHAYLGDDSNNTGRYDDFLSCAAEGRCCNADGTGWTSKKTAEFGDIYLFWFGQPISTIAGIGVSQGCDGIPRQNEGWDWTDAEYGFFCDYEPLVALASPITIEDIKAERLLADWWTGRPFQGRPKSVKDPKVAHQMVNLILEQNSDRITKQILQPFQKTTTTQ